MDARLYVITQQEGNMLPATSSPITLKAMIDVVELTALEIDQIADLHQNHERILQVNKDGLNIKVTRIS